MDKMIPRWLVSGGVAVLAAIAVFIGLAALKWYLWDIVIQQADEADRSMLFWGIPIVFIGIASLAVGIRLAAFARRGSSGRTSDEPPVEL
jgi:MFS superfamily sulfate permease-like transporter